MIKNLNIEHIKKEFKKIQNYFTTGNYEKVIEKTEVLLKKDKQVPFYNLLGLSYRQLGQQENAEEIFKKGLKIFPNNISILSNIGAFYRSTGKSTRGSKDSRVFRPQLSKSCTEFKKRDYRAG